MVGGVALKAGLEMEFEREWKGMGRVKGGFFGAFGKKTGGPRL